MGTWQPISGILIGMANSILFVTRADNQPASLYRNEGDYFIDVARKAGIAVPTMAPVKWGTGFGDFDNDGWLDILVANGNFSSLLDTLPKEYRFAEPHSTLSQPRKSHF